MLSYEELLNKYNTILKENEELNGQIKNLKIKLGMPIETEEKTILETSGTGINKYSSLNEKILLYRSLFCGREDVFARRWYSKTTEKSGYQPVCENEWLEDYVTKGNINVQLAQIVNFPRLQTKISINILRVKIIMAEML